MVDEERAALKQEIQGLGRRLEFGVKLAIVAIAGLIILVVAGVTLGEFARRTAEQRNAALIAHNAEEIVRLQNLLDNQERLTRKIERLLELERRNLRLHHNQTIHLIGEVIRNGEVVRTIVGEGVIQPGEGPGGGGGGGAPPPEPPQVQPSPAPQPPPPPPDQVGESNQCPPNNPHC